MNSNKIPLKIQIFSGTGHISSTHELHVASGYCTGQFRYRIFPSLRKVLLDSAGLDAGDIHKHTCLHFNDRNEETIIQLPF